MDNQKLKKRLFNLCEEFVNSKLTTIENTIKSNQEGLASETKSSAGDKHETGRAMMQLEMEKAGKQLKVVREMKETLDRINIQENSRVCKLGSIVKTDKVNYFIAISAGQFFIEGDNYYAVSSKSPIGKILIGKREKDEVSFNNNTFKIIDLL